MQKPQTSNGKTTAHGKAPGHVHGLSLAGDEILRTAAKGTTAVSDTVMRTNADMAGEMTTFLSRRLERHSNFWSDIARCSSPSDWLEVQSNFLRTMTDDYRDEWMRMFGKVGMAAKQVQEDIGLPEALASKNTES